MFYDFIIYYNENNFFSKTVALLILVICSFSSCDLRIQDNGPDFVDYNLLLNYKDISGNDLVKGLGEIDSNTSRLYKLEIVLPEPCDNWVIQDHYITDTVSPKVFYKLFNDHYYFTAYFGIPVDDCPTTKMITHKVKCPELFGDDAVREIVSYWNIPPKKTSHYRYAKCYRIEFEGNEITPTPMDKYEHVYVATIILNY